MIYLSFSVAFKWPGGLLPPGLANVNENKYMGLRGQETYARPWSLLMHDLSIVRQTHECDDSRVKAAEHYTGIYRHDREM
jgi:hypothetical protein